MVRYPVPLALTDLVTYTLTLDIYQNELLTKSRAYLVSQWRPGVYGLSNAIDPHLHQRKLKLVRWFHF